MTESTYRIHGAAGASLCFVVAGVVGGCSPVSYDECILDSVGSGSNELAIETAQESCRRLTEVEKVTKLDAVVSRELKPYEDGTRRIYLQVSNDTTDIITLIDVKISKENEIRYDTWIEPARWVELELPEDKNIVPATLNVGDPLQALSVKVIQGK